VLRKLYLLKYCAYQLRLSKQKWTSTVLNTTALDHIPPFIKLVAQAQCVSAVFFTPWLD